MRPTPETIRVNTLQDIIAVLYVLVFLLCVYLLSREIYIAIQHAKTQRLRKLRRELGDNQTPSYPPKGYLN